MGTYENARLKTKEKIIKAFWKLYREKSIDKITVKDITDACKIHRATFYLHFADVYAVLERMEEALLNELKELCMFEDDVVRDSYEIAHKVYFHYLQRWEYLHYMLKESVNSGFSAAYKAVLVEAICRMNRINLNEMTRKERNIAQVVLEGMVEMFIICADEDMFTFDDLMHIMSGYANEGMNRVLRDQYNISLQLSFAKK